MGSYNYNRENTRRVVLALNKRTDADIITALEAQENMQSYLKTLIRADIEKSADHAEGGNTMKNDHKKLWYAVMQDKEDNDWGYGSEDLEKAKQMARDLDSDNAYIAVIDVTYDDPVCIDEIEL